MASAVVLSRVQRFLPLCDLPALIAVTENIDRTWLAMLRQRLGARTLGCGLTPHLLDWCFHSSKSGWQMRVGMCTRRTCCVSNVCCFSGFTEAVIVSLSLSSRLSLEVFLNGEALTTLEPVSDHEFDSLEEGDFKCPYGGDGGLKRVNGVLCSPGGEPLQRGRCSFIGYGEEIYGVLGVKESARASAVFDRYKAEVDVQIIGTQTDPLVNGALRIFGKAWIVTSQRRAMGWCNKVQMCYEDALAFVEFLWKRGFFEKTDGIYWRRCQLPYTLVTKPECLTPKNILFPARSGTISQRHSHLLTESAPPTRKRARPRSRSPPRRPLRRETARLTT